MNKLSDYELDGGEWVKFHYHGWLEFVEYDFKDTYYFYTLNDKNSGKFGPGVLVEAVLRPSIIIRDKLDEALKYQSTYNLSFEIIHPRKNSVIPLKSKLDELIEGTKEMLLKLDEIEKNILESSK